jgi:hypothetical protein
MDSRPVPFVTGMIHALVHPMLIVAGVRCRPGAR